MKLSMNRGGKPRQNKSQPIQWLEYFAVWLGILLAKMIPLKLGHFICEVLGHLIYLAVPRRRRIAAENLRHAFQGSKSEREIKEITRQSCASFILSLLETVKFKSLLDDPAGMKRIREATEGFDLLLQKVKELHEKPGGCVFVTPHIGNWEFLPFIGFMAGIPLVVVVRPLDNRYLEDLLYSERATSGQIIMPKTNSLYLLQRALRQGKSICMLPDQSTMKAISVEYFGMKATTTPIPAILALLYKRPIVVVACCRKSKDFRFEGFVSEPIWPQAYQSERDEIFRLTREMNRKMEAIIRKYPEQYFWMHNRWKTYQTKKDLSLSTMGFS